jgi:DNA-binding beta-propeller fold protein YncE
VASTADETVSIFTIAGGRLTPAGKVKMPIGSRPVDVVFAPDGRSAYVTAQNANRLFRLSVDGAKVARADAGVQTGAQPFQVVTGRDGRYVYVTHLVGRLLPQGQARPPGPNIGTVAVVDTTTGTVANIVDMGVIPEHIALSPDGRHLAVVVVNGSSSSPESPNYNPQGFLKVFRVEGSNLVHAGEARTGRWCQGALWTSDSRRIILQCAIDRHIESFGFNGSAVTREPELVKFTGRPGAFASAGWR